MKSLSKLSIRKKLMVVLLLTSASALVFSALGFAVNDWFSVRSVMFDRLRAHAEIIGNNSVAALTFGDPDSARDTLSSLNKEAGIVGAALFTHNAAFFAYYQRDDSRPIPLTLPGTNSGSIDGNIFVVASISLDGEHIGNILILSDFSYWQHRRLSHLFVAIGVLLLSLLVALLFSSRLQRVVSEPILNLAQTARRVSETQDYSLRAVKISRDEIGSLVDDFNGMLGQIQHRDHALQRAREELEGKVEARTSELTELAQQLKHQAYHDTLTGLANRITFDDHLNLAISQARRTNGRLAVMFLDLDRFKVVNDTLGHAIGDKLLMEVSRRLSACLRGSDTLARLGGDEFAVLIAQTRHGDDVADVTEVARKLTETIAEPMEIDGYSLHPTTSIGISLYPEDGVSAETIVKNADTAMYRSKDRGRNRFTFFSAEMNARAVRRLSLETKLREAIRKGAFTIHYQPRLDTDTLECVGVEALLRWNDPDEGPIPPSEFIPLAEECGLIATIDEWVLEHACIELLSWYDGAIPDIRLSVNLSPAQFIREDMHQVIAAILERTGFPGQRLELEITESLFGPDSADACNILEHLRELGIELAIDDFGTAYSSLSRLKQLPLNTLKIDQSFIRDLGRGPDDETLVRTIITMAHNLNLAVVAEGVETELQYRFVQQHGCDTVQGFLFSRPIPGPEMAAVLRAPDSTRPFNPLQ